MKFIVRFLAKCGHAADTGNFGIGLGGVDRIRKELCTCYLALDRIQDFIYPYMRNPEIRISEKIARKSGLFQNQKYLTVIVCEKHLNGFMKNTVQVEKNGKTGEISNASLVWELDEKSAIFDWESRGFPTEIIEGKGEKK